MREQKIRIKPNFLFLTEDKEKLRRQLDGRALTWSGEKLIDNISTDELTPGWVCFYYDETLAEYVYLGLRGDIVKKNDIKKNSFNVIVSGKSKGCGSSRETAPYAELWAGAQLVIAESIEKIYGQNSVNIGLLLSTDFGLIDRIKSGEEIPLEEFTKGLDPIGAEIVRYGGLFAYNKARREGKTVPPALNTPKRPMNLVEKIIASHAIVDAKTGKTGLPGVKVGDALFVKTDVRFSHEYVTPMAAASFKSFLGKDAKVTEPQSIYAFRDHLTFLGDVMSDEKKAMGLLSNANNLAEVQRQFCKDQNIRLYDERSEGGSEAICHNAILEDIGEPGQIIVGSDSHTCTAGALGAFAFGMGSTDIANTWYTNDTRIRVPEVIRYDLTGTLPAGVSGKDLMLYIMSRDYLKSGKGIGKVLEFGGPGLATLAFDERATLTNMAVEAGGFTGIMEADEVVLKQILQYRPNANQGDIRKRFLRADPDAEYAARFTIDLNNLEPMVATPGDPRNGLPLTELGEIRIDIAYGGSCTGGKKSDMDMYASVFKKAVAEGRKVKEGIECYIQFGSQHVKEYAKAQGYIAIFEKAGVKLIDPSCGACINAGPGVSRTKDQVSVSAINRNFPGRSGPGHVYLASPYVVAASALEGFICAPGAHAKA